MGTNIFKLYTFKYCSNQDQDYQNTYILKFIQQFHSQIWYPSFYTSFQNHHFHQSDKVKYKKTNQKSHYSNRLINQQQNQLTFYCQLQKLTPSEKQSYLKNLISKSYMILDQQEIPQSADILFPDATSKAFWYNEYTMNSVLSGTQNQQIREQKFYKLRNFDEQVLKYFDRFVRFCMDIKQELKDNKSLLGKLFFNFKIDLKRTYSVKINQRNKILHKIKLQFLMSIKTFIYSIQQLLIIIYDLNKLAQLEKLNTFFTEVNLHTLICSLIFKDITFSQLVVQIYEKTLKNKIQLYQSKKAFMNINLSSQFSLNKNTINYFRSIGWRNQQLSKDNIELIFMNTKCQSVAYGKCLKMLQKVIDAQEPILKLKIIYQIGLKIESQIKEFYQKNQIDVKNINLNAETFLQIILYIMKSFTSSKIVIHLTIINDFIHDYYKNSKKGCFFAPFLIAIEGHTFKLS